MKEHQTNKQAVVFSQNEWEVKRDGEKEKTGEEGEGKRVRLRK